MRLRGFSFTPVAMPACSDTLRRTTRAKRTFGDADLKIATYNVNGRLPQLLDGLAATAPDIVCLQEIKTSDDKVPSRANVGIVLADA